MLTLLRKKNCSIILIFQYQNKLPNISYVASKHYRKKTDIDKSDSVKYEYKVNVGFKVISYEFHR